MSSQSITTPLPSQHTDLREKALEISRKSREFPVPLPTIIPVAAENIDPDADDNIASQALASLYNSDKYSDLTIKCRDRIWLAHRAVVCSQSKVLAACVDNPFIESHTGIIDLSEDEPEIVEHMMSYLYKGYYDFENPIPAMGYEPTSASTKAEWRSWFWRRDLPPPQQRRSGGDGRADITPHYARPRPSLLTNPPGTSTTTNGQTEIFGRIAPTPSRLITHASVYCLAEQYDLPRLKTHALSKYASLAPTALPSPFFIPSLLLIYDRTPSHYEPSTEIDDLRAIAAKTAAEHCQELMSKIEFLEACTQNGEIATDVLRMTLVLRKMEVKVDWKPGVSCERDAKHELVYIPSLTGFGMGSGEAAGRGGSSGVAMQGFGSKTGGKYKCIPCGRTIKS